MSADTIYDRPAARGVSCWLCGFDAWRLLPIPHAEQSMLSDGSVLHAPLAKCSCAKCGLLQHVEQRGAAEIKALFGPSYQLGEQEPGAGFEGVRQRLYAAWIRDAVGTAPASIVDFGCGNGSLLVELTKTFPSSQLRGLEASAQGVARARGRGLAVDFAYVGAEPTVAARAADLVVSVNVIEHTRAPVEFARAAAWAATRTGQVLTVCPDGDMPSSELLFFDHFHSLTAANLEATLVRAGLAPAWRVSPPAELRGFQMSIARLGERADSARAEPRELDRLHAARAAYLRRWQNLDQTLREALDGYASLAIFGIGEMAHLLRAYAPRVWDRVDAFVIDDPLDREFHGRPVVPYAEMRPAADRLLLLAVANRSVERLRARLEAAGHRTLAVEDAG